LRPLMRGDGADTKSVSREHAVHVSNSGLVTIVGGKWTTYRKMAEDALADAILVGGLEARPCVTESLVLHGWMRRDDPQLPSDPAMRVYGADAAHVDALAREDASWSRPIHPELPYRGVHVVFAVRHELARTLEDVLSRRTRALLLDARASIEAAPAVAALMASELGRDAAWARAQVAAYEALARGYLLDA
ncbi:MAG TPA: glycerol-3-phosphate dehydrogenase C-terminal domain-containing protein, partial [Myxococcota bacterium]|nr:glycerol-3-phosphate dehydrogenase C-terminal domain-containing protein [Myxococcota bacterium]